MSSRNLPTLPVVTPMLSDIPVIPHQYASPGLSLAQLYAMLHAYRKQTLIIVIGVTLLAGIVTKLMPKSYTATATLMVNYEASDPLAGREFPIGLLGTYMATQIELMQSPEVLLPVVDRLNLVNNSHYASGYHGTPAGLRDWVEKNLEKNLDIELGRGSQLIYVNYTASNPVEAAQVANAVADVYSEQQSLRSIGPASERAQRYTQQLNELKDKVTRAQEQVTNFRQRTGVIGLESNVDAEATQLAALQERLLEAQNNVRAAQAKAAGNRAVADDVMQSNLIQGLKTQLASQQAHMAELRATLGERHPEVVQLQSQIDATKQELAAQVQSYSDNASAEVASALELERKLQKAVDEQRKKVLAERQLRDEGDKLLLELESAQSVYKRALDGYDQIMFASTGRYTNVSFVSKATPPVRHSKPKAIKNVVLGFLAGCFFGVVGPLLYELLNRRVRCRDDIERDHGIPVLVEFDAARSSGAAP